ncbi:MAG: transaldolase [Simkania sp.]|nr:transaldolase [Simkania sp.]
MNALDHLRLSSVLAVDSALFFDYGRFNPTHATTNPSILLAAAQNSTYQHLLEQADTPLELAVLFGAQILQRIPGHVSIQLNPQFSFDTEAIIKEAHQCMTLCTKAHLPLDRVLLKIAATWEGIQAIKDLERQGIRCNATMVLSLTQALKASDVGATCIAPYVGRITDWYQTHSTSLEDMGVTTLSLIYHTLKKHGYQTRIMAASFRTPEQILALCGCDILTISPKLLDALLTLHSLASRKLSPHSSHLRAPLLSEKDFRWELCNHPCASYLLDDGIRRFTKDSSTLENLLHTPLK